MVKLRQNIIWQLGPNIILMALYSIFFLPLNYDFAEPVFSHTSSASGMVNKMNHIPTLPSTVKCPELHQPMLGIKSKLYSSKHFIQNNPEVKNNLYHLFLQESPAKDGLLPFKFLKTLNLSYRDTGYVPLLMRSCFPASAPRSFCLIRYSILIGCFNKTFCLVKYIVQPRKI